MVNSKEVYTVLLRSTDGEGADCTKVKYFIDWGSLLPTTNKRYLLKVLFRGEPDDTANTEEWLFIKVNGLTNHMWDSETKGKSQVVGNAVRYQANEVGNEKWGYTTPATDVHGVMVEYPFNNLTEVTITKPDGDVPATLNNWSVWLQFSPIE